MGHTFHEVAPIAVIGKLLRNDLTPYALTFLVYFCLSLLLLKSNTVIVDGKGDFWQLFHIYYCQCCCPGLGWHEI